MAVFLYILPSFSVQLSMSFMQPRHFPSRVRFPGTFYPLLPSRCSGSLAVFASAFGHFQSQFRPFHCFSLSLSALYPTPHFVLRISWKKEYD